MWKFRWDYSVISIYLIQSYYLHWGVQTVSLLTKSKRKSAPIFQHIFAAATKTSRNAASFHQLSTGQPTVESSSPPLRPLMAEQDSKDFQSPQEGARYGWRRGGGGSRQKTVLGRCGHFCEDSIDGVVYSLKQTIGISVEFNSWQSWSRIGQR